MPVEILLIAACCRRPASDERTAAIRAAAKDVSDWERLVGLIKRHRVAMLVRAALREATIEPPSSAAGELDAFVERHIRRGLRLGAETVRLQDILAAADIPAVALKGVALEQLAYGDIATKQTRDIDLLISPECVETAMHLLERHGYRVSLPASRLNKMQRRALIQHGREVELVDPRRKVRVELQWHLADNPALLCGVDAYSVAQTVNLSEGTSVRTLAPDDLFAYLCVHGAHHCWSRLKWLADLNALIVSTATDIEHVYRHAQKVGAGLCAGQALLLCEQLLGLKLPTALAEELQADKRCRKLVDLAIEALVAPNTASEGDPGIWGVVRELRYQFLLGSGWRFYAMQIRVVLVGVADIVRLPLPRPLHFIYPLVRVPLWLWRRAKLALAPL